jgi:hypothetical protein
MVFSRQSKLWAKNQVLVLEVDCGLLQIRESQIQAVRAEEVLAGHEHHDVVTAILVWNSAIDVVSDQLLYDLLLVLCMFAQYSFRLLCHLNCGFCVNWDPVAQLVRLPHQRVSLDLSVLVICVRNEHQEPAHSV